METLEEESSCAVVCYEILVRTFFNRSSMIILCGHVIFNSQLHFVYSNFVLGVTPYSKVGIISNNRHEWATIAAATYSLNATLVPMYEGM